MPNNFCQIMAGARAMDLFEFGVVKVAGRGIFWAWNYSYSWIFIPNSG